MPYINLLPWREEAQKVKERQFFTLLAGVAFSAFLLVFIVAQLYQLIIDGQRQRNQFIKNEIQILDLRIGQIRKLNDKKKALEQRMAVVEQLQMSRNVGTEVLDEIAKIVPAGIYLTRMEKQGNSLFLVGKSESNNHLANMIREIESSKLFTEATLESITSAEQGPKLLSNFRMNVRIQGLLQLENDVQAKGGK
jgi:type IV pilus assembly protein PilN